MKPELTETILYEQSPAMFRNHPVGFILALLLTPVAGLGLLILFFWWLNTISTVLQVTDRRISLRHGILSKHTNDIFHNDVRNVRMDQTFFQRLFHVGDLGISSSGQSGIEIEVSGLPDPETVKGLIDQYR